MNTTQDEIHPYGDVTPPVAVDQLDDLAGPAADVAHDAGTPLSALATTPAEDGQARKLERLDAHVELEDGTAWDVKILNRDFVAFDLVRAKRKWPAAEEAPFVLNNFLSWNAARREGLFAGSFEAFVDAADLVKLTRSDPARPTR